MKAATEKYTAHLPKNRNASDYVTLRMVRGAVKATDEYGLVEYFCNGHLIECNDHYTYQPWQVRSGRNLYFETLTDAVAFCRA